MKKLLVFLALFITGSQSFSQISEVATSPEFKEPESGMVKIASTPEGETVLIHIDEEDFAIKKYDRDHHLVADKKVENTFGKLKRGHLLNVAIQDGKIVVFTSETENRRPMLYRQIIDLKTCNIIDEQLIDSFPKIKIKVGMIGVNISDRDVNRRSEFYVITDPATGAYAIAAYNTMLGAENQVKISHYNKHHELLGSAFFFLLGNPYDYYDYKGMYVEGEKSVFVTVMAEKGKAEKLYLAELGAASGSFLAKEVKSPLLKDISDVVSRYSPATNQYISICSKPNKGGSNTFRVIWDRNKDTVTTEPMSGAMITAGRKSGWGTWSVSTPVAQKIYMNPDGSYKVIFEDITTKVTQYNSGGGRFGSRDHLSEKIYMNNVAVAKFDNSGKLTNTTILPKSHLCPHYAHRGPYDLTEIDQEGMRFTVGLQFKTFYYWPGKDKEYILFVDDEKNQERLDKRQKPVTVQALENCRSYYLSLSGERLPKREELFKEEVNRKNRPLLVSAVSNYNETTGELATLKVNYENKKACISWLKAD